MQIKVYGYRGCSTCKKAYAFLQKNGMTFTEVDITKEAPTPSELKDMLKALQGQLKKLFNTSGQVYREQQIGKKLATFSDDEALKLLAENGRLVKRPFLLVGGKAVTVGFDETKWLESIGEK